MKSTPLTPHQTWHLVVNFSHSFRITLISRWQVLNPYVHNIYEGKFKYICSFSTDCWNLSRERWIFYLTYGLLTVRVAWWGHDMETLSALLASCEGNRLVTGGEFSSQRASERELRCFLCGYPGQVASDLTHCGLVTPYGDIDLGQHWSR